MKITSENGIRNFQFWSGAVDTVKHLTGEQLDTIEGMLEDIYPNGISETELNDIFWFEDDLIAEWLGFNSFDELMEQGA